jgi:hypothetical protein
LINSSLPRNHQKNGYNSSSSLVFSPSWALEGVKTEKFTIQYGPGNGTVETLPLPWDEVYLRSWFAVAKQLSERYGKSAAFRFIAADGPTSVSAEFTLPSSPEDVRKWISLGYTPRKYLAAWQKVFQTFAATFPNQYVSLSVGAGLNINDGGKIAPREGQRTRQEAIDQAIGLLGRRFVLQNSDLHAGPDQHPVTELVIIYSGRVITGLQMRCPAERCSQHGRSIAAVQIPTPPQGQAPGAPSNVRLGGRSRAKTARITRSEEPNSRQLVVVQGFG